MSTGPYILLEAYFSDGEIGELLAGLQARPDRFFRRYKFESPLRSK